MAVFQRTRAGAISALVGIAAALMLSVDGTGRGANQGTGRGAVRASSSFPCWLSHRCVCAERHALGQRLCRLFETG